MAKKTSKRKKPAKKRKASKRKRTVKRKPVRAQRRRNPIVKKVSGKPNTGWTLALVSGGAISGAAVTHMLAKR